MAQGAAASLPPAPSLPLDRVRLPPGFQISLYTNATFPARFIALGQVTANATVVYVSSTVDSVTAIVDRGGGAQPQACTLLSGLDNPNGIAYEPATGALYVAEVTRITRWQGADAAALAGCDAAQLSSAVVTADLPDQKSHSNRALGIGPRDGKLYVTVAAPFNVDVCEDPFCTIHRLNKDGSGMEIFARGIRNAAGWDWHPDTGALLFAGMERDNMAPDYNNRPDDVLVAVERPGMDFLWPYCHWEGSGDPEDREPGPGSAISDPDVTFPDYPAGARPADSVIAQRCAASAPPPVQALGPHVAPLGVLFWPGPAGGGAADGAAAQQRWPAQYDGSVFVGEHGSWNREEPIGYRVSNVQLAPNSSTAVGHTIFADGWLGPNGRSWGRPVGMARLPDGSMLLADDDNGVVYRISYSSGGSAAAPPPPPSSGAAGARLAGVMLAAASLVALLLS